MSRKRKLKLKKNKSKLDKVISLCVGKVCRRRELADATSNDKYGASGEVLRKLKDAVCLEEFIKLRAAGIVGLTSLPHVFIAQVSNELRKANGLRYTRSKTARVVELRMTDKDKEDYFGGRATKRALDLYHRRKICTCRLLDRAVRAGKLDRSCFKFASLSSNTHVSEVKGNGRTWLIRYSVSIYGGWNRARRRILMVVLGEKEFNTYHVTRVPSTKITIRQAKEWTTPRSVISTQEKGLWTAKLNEVWLLEKKTGKDDLSKAPSGYIWSEELRALYNPNGNSITVPHYVKRVRAICCRRICR